MTVGAKFIRSAAWMTAGNWTEQAINFAVFVTMARLLGAEAFGLLSMAAVFIVVSEALVRESVAESLISTAAPEAEDFNAVFWLTGGVGVVLAGVLYAAAGPIATVYGHPEVKGLIMALAPSVVLVAFNAVPVAILRREFNFRVMSIRAVAGVIAGGTTGVAMALTGHGVWSFVGQWLVMIATNAAIAWAVVDWRPGLRFGAAHLRRASGFGFQVLGLRSGELAMVQMPILIIGATLGPLATGLYSVSWRLVEILSFLASTGFRMASQPAFAAVSRARGKTGELLVEILRLTALVAFPFFAGLAALAEPMLLLVFGPEWLGAAPVLRVMAALGLYLCVASVQTSFCLAAGRAGRLTVLTWLGVGLSTALVFAASGWGLVAITAGFVLAHYVLWVFRFRLVARLGSIAVAPLLGTLAAPFLASAAMVIPVLLVARWAEGAGLAALLAASVGVGVLTYAVLTLIFMRDRLRLLMSYVRPAVTDPAPDRAERVAGQ
ncbi:lipopolysaccharide biosynthesis protein [Defluviimonas sp. WL0024]|uniref:Lipopolysaccharide biosynthesis protein n=1 Tax=Albidovulum salinarum TaxID=2984153 RepID=A0ABT2X6L6_9RHOB|nr:lipopolysaccharide biosynthesis protein [Defluviimonas sp. WL0024]MCU9849596.1 lipopolysaccharide biosynthesis protein [Defluviimonas sp. WL0024]